MSSDILLSVKPRFSRQIAAGTKTVELRRRPLRVPSGTTMWIYSTLPSGSVEVVARVRTIQSGCPKTLWHRFGEQAGVTREEFFEYYSGLQLGYVVSIENAEPIRSEVPLDAIRRVEPKFQPPQFFTWLHRNSPVLTLLTSRHKKPRKS